MQWMLVYAGFVSVTFTLKYRSVVVYLFTACLTMLSLARAVATFVKLRTVWKEAAGRPLNWGNVKHLHAGTEQNHEKLQVIASRGSILYVAAVRSFLSHSGVAQVNELMCVSTYPSHGTG
jgi:hypothetical protein